MSVRVLEPGAVVSERLGTGGHIRIIKQYVCTCQTIYEYVFIAVEYLFSCEPKGACADCPLLYRHMAAVQGHPLRTNGRCEPQCRQA